MDNLPELRDIHLPTEGVPVFPLAYGWWGLFGLIIAAILLFKSAMWLYRASARIYAHKLLYPLQGHVDLKSAVKMSEILRRICVRKYPQAVALSGNEWIEFLNKNSKTQLSGEAAELLKNAPFMPEDSALLNQKNHQTLWKFCYNWIGDNL